LTKHISLCLKNINNAPSGSTSVLIRLRAEERQPWQSVKKNLTGEVVFVKENQRDNFKIAKNNCRLIILSQNQDWKFNKYPKLAEHNFFLFLKYHGLSARL